MKIKIKYVKLFFKLKKYGINGIILMEGEDKNVR